MRRHLTYQNAMATIAALLLIAGGTAFAAAQLAKNSVGKKQLKANAVTTAKIKKNAVTKAKIKNGAVNGAKVADGSITGTKLASGAPYSQLTTKLRFSGPIDFAPPGIVPLPGTYTQNAGEDLRFLGDFEVGFAASCEAPRTVIVILLQDSSGSMSISQENFLGLAKVTDLGSGAVSRTGQFEAVVGAPMSRMSAASTASHSLSILMANFECKSGSGVSLNSAGVDVLGLR
ncbi:MAG TPA: hypothetical protein VIT85_02070 [Solirubrobacterales bacterium]